MGSGIRRHHDDRNRGAPRVARELAQKGCAVHVRHLDVQENDARARFKGERCERILPVSRFLNPVPLELEEFTKCASKLLIVVHDENRKLRIGHSQKMSAAHERR